jgi:CIC family chloride channel protein
MALKVRDRLRMSEEAFHLFIAGVVGIIGGLSQIAYYFCHQLLQLLFLGGSGDILVLAQSMSGWMRVLLPTLGGLAAGLVLHVGFRVLRSGSESNFLEAVVAGDGRLAVRPALVNALSSLLSISSGASIGKEGLVVQLAATIASRLGTVMDWPPYRLRLLVACGAASGLSAGCNAPIAGAVFAAQIVLGNFAMNLFAPVVFSSVIAIMVSRSFVDTGQWYVVPSFHFDRLGQLPWFLLLGGCCGLAGAWFLGGLGWAQRFFGRLGVPIYLKLGLGGLAVGLIALEFPEVWGNGYGATNKILGFKEGPQIFWMVCGLTAAKVAATILSVGSGAVGGIFTPTLFLGASLGSLFGAVLHLGGVAGELPVGVFALVGMGSVLAATTHSPLLAMIMAFELSLNYSLMPPLMLACVVSALVGRRFHQDSIYTEPLRRRGLEGDVARGSGATAQRVGDFMREPVPPIREDASFREIADRFLTGPNNFLPVLDGEQRLVGVVALQDLKDSLHEGALLNGIIASDLMRPVPQCLTPDLKLAEALPILIASELRNVPVVDSNHGRRLIGRVARAEVIGVMTEELTATRLK